ncbi:protein UL148B [Panine betaherpesvirus 2]|uniref:Protein UL148B n=1 Tax=Panine betaherpesvirus 2 TaxID=188763 RepID=Q8QRW4_9BETA|nr:protein UL148B [Panine betaherpesvirus 2]AAM00774.1 protein UL148B [Panine betaherpesvirus 2]QXV67888.1 protein UL148B [Panine betaherpesvirus 2]
MMETLTILAICVGVVMGCTVLVSCALISFYYYDEITDGQRPKLFRRGARRGRQFDRSESMTAILCEEGASSDEGECYTTRL